MIDYQLLTLCPVFRGISETEAEKLLKQIHFQVKKFAKDEIVVVAGEHVTNLNIVIFGKRAWRND